MGEGSVCACVNVHVRVNVRVCVHLYLHGPQNISEFVLRVVSRVNDNRRRHFVIFFLHNFVPAVTDEAITSKCQSLLGQPKNFHLHLLERNLIRTGMAFFEPESKVENELTFWEKRFSSRLPKVFQ